MDLEDQNGFQVADRFAAAADTAAAARDWLRAIAAHESAATAYSRLLTAGQAIESVAAIHLLVEAHKSQQQLIQTALDIQSGLTKPRAGHSHAAAPHPRLLSPQPASHSPPLSLGPPVSRPSQQLIPAPFSHAHLIQRAEPEPLLPIVRLLQIVQIFLLSDFDMATGDDSYARVQSCIHGMAATIEQISQCSAQSQQLTPEENTELVTQLNTQLAGASELHRFLQSQKDIGLSASQLATFHQQFLVVQKQAHAIARSELSLQRAASKTAAGVSSLTASLNDSLATLERILASAARSAALKVAARDGNAQLAVDEAASQKQAPMLLIGSDAAELRALQAEKEQMQRRIALLEREMKAERLQRLKADKMIAKHEERWRSLNEKVAAKKAQTATAGASSPSSSALGAIAEGSPSSSAAALSASASSASSKPPSLSQQGRSSSTGSTAPALHVAKPVQLFSPAPAAQTQRGPAK